jgi:predicted GNAT family acetyltransferase
MSDYKVIHKPESNRFEIHEDGRVAYVEYYIHDGALDILHTIVPMSLENRGIGSALVKGAYDWAQTEGLEPMATCYFAAAWLKRHPEYVTA